MTALESNGDTKPQLQMPFTHGSRIADKQWLIWTSQQHTYVVLDTIYAKVQEGCGSADMTRQLLNHACDVTFNCQDNASFHACQASLQNRCVACLASSEDGATEALSLHVCFDLKLRYGMIVWIKSNTRRQVQHLSEMKSSIADNAEHVHTVSLLTPTHSLCRDADIPRQFFGLAPRPRGHVSLPSCRSELDRSRQHRLVARQLTVAERKCGKVS